MRPTHELIERETKTHRKFWSSYVRIRAEYIIHNKCIEVLFPRILFEDVLIIRERADQLAIEPTWQEWHQIQFVCDVKEMSRIQGVWRQNLTLGMIPMIRHYSQASKQEAMNKA